MKLIFRINLLLVFTSITLSTCIDPYYVNLSSSSKPKYMVYGNVTDQEGYQTVSVSISSKIQEPKDIPVSNCMVQIIDSTGNVFNLSEYEEGKYRTWMSKNNLVPGHSYKVNILTQNGVEIVSEFDKMPKCPEIDSIYYKREDLLTSDPQNNIQGIRFYVDIDAENMESKYFRWELIETWEHHATYPKVWYWHKRAYIRVNPPDYSRLICWTTQPISEIFTLTTNGLTHNSYKQHKLHFVDNLTQRLTYCYSLLINQYALSKSTYDYWEKQRMNSNKNESLYETQPFKIHGNLKSTSNPEQEVLGIFSASSLRSKRIFIREVPNLERLFPSCAKDTLKEGFIFDISRDYYIMFEDRNTFILEDKCIECDFESGTNKKPNFWPY